MEAYGFARASVPGEYSPQVVTAAVTTDISNTSSYATILTVTVNVVSLGEVLTIVGSLVSVQGATGGTPVMRFTVDGTTYLGAGKTVGFGGAKSNVRQVLIVEGLSIGPHTVTLDWKNANSSTIKASSVPTQCHAVLLCQRNKPVSLREMDGFPTAGWPMIYTLGTAYQTLAASNTSTSTTITTSLFSGVTVQTRYPQSALLIRFSASGVNNDTVNELDTKFQLLVDGIAACGTGNATGFTQGLFNASFVCVAPVQAGFHKLDVNWAGGASPGTTIDPTSDGSHAVISAEEVFCGDIDSLSDMEGFSAVNFASRFLPRVGYSALTTDHTNGTGTETLLQQMFYVTGEQSAVVIEFTGSLVSGGVEPVLQILVDGTAIHGATETATSGFMQCISVEAALNLAQGNHLIQLTMLGIASFTPATHPEYSHANMVVREVAKL